MLHETPMSTMGAMSRISVCLFETRAAGCSLVHEHEYLVEPNPDAAPEAPTLTRRRSIASSARQIISLPTAGSRMTYLAL